MDNPVINTCLETLCFDIKYTAQVNFVVEYSFLLYVFYVSSGVQIIVARKKSQSDKKLHQTDN